MGENTPSGDGLAQSFERAMAGFEHASEQLGELLASGKANLSEDQMRSLQNIALSLQGREVRTRSDGGEQL